MDIAKALTHNVQNALSGARLDIAASKKFVKCMRWVEAVPALEARLNITPERSGGREVYRDVWRVVA